MERVCEQLGVSQRRVCQVITQPRATQRYSQGRDLDKDALVSRIVELATRYGRYGYRRVTALLKREGWRVNHKRVERIWRIEGLKVPGKQPKRGRLWLNDGSCIRLRPERKDHVWSYDFVAGKDRRWQGFPYPGDGGRVHQVVFSHGGEAEHHITGCPGPALHAVPGQRGAGAHTLGQRPRVHLQSSEGMAI